MNDVPELECDIVMKGGITSGVVYPLALQRFGQTYRLRGVGGSSAGAIGAAMGAAAEYNRAGGGFEELGKLPQQLGGGQLQRLFVPSPGTRATLAVLLAAVDSRRHGWRKALGVLLALVSGHPIGLVIGALPGVALVGIGVEGGDAGTAGVVLAVVGVLLMLLGGLIGATYAAWYELTRRVIANLFGICRGLGRGGQQGFTDWLAERIDTTAGMPQGQTLLFGDLWRGPAAAADGEALVGPVNKHVDLQMMTTCLSQGRPYQLPTDTRGFYYDPVEWQTLFPDYVMRALEAAPDPWDGRPEAELTASLRESRWEATAAANAVVAGRARSLRRLPSAEYLPVVVATRMSMSFPLLISMIPMYAVDWRSPLSQAARDGARQAIRSGHPLPEGSLDFNQLWFSDGGLCSNFPVHLFDSALPTRPTFAINLGKFPEGRGPDQDQTHNVEWAEANQPLLPDINEMKTRGVAALIGFAAAAVNTARNWQDNSHLNFPGFRDRIVRVLQTKAEGGLNLAMDAAAIDELSDRGRTAADVMVGQFTKPNYDGGATGWDNHRWVRYRALMGSLPAAMVSFKAGLGVLDTDPEHPPSFRYTSQVEREVAQALTEAMAGAADVVAAPGAAKRLTQSAPRPLGIIRRIPPL